MVSAVAIFIIAINVYIYLKQKGQNKMKSYSRIARQFDVYIYYFAKVLEFHGLLFLISEKENKHGQNGTSHSGKLYEFATTDKQ